MEGRIVRSDRKASPHLNRLAGSRTLCRKPVDLDARQADRFAEIPGDRAGQTWQGRSGRIDWLGHAAVLAVATVPDHRVSRRRRATAQVENINFNRDAIVDTSETDPAADPN